MDLILVVSLDDCTALLQLMENIAHGACRIRKPNCGTAMGTGCIARWNRGNNPNLLAADSAFVRQALSRSRGNFHYRSIWRAVVVPCSRFYPAGPGCRLEFRR